MHHRETNPYFSTPLQPPPHEDPSHPPGPGLQPPPGQQHQGPRGQPPRGSRVPISITDLDGPPQRPRERIQEPPLTPSSPPPVSPAIQDPRLDPESGRATPTGKSHQEPRQSQQRLRVPTLQKTKPHTWFGAFFCLMFWLVIIIGGLIVLIVYLVFRPQNPRFDVSYASLNAAYLDMGSLLNADFRMLANFSNPNKKVHVDFSSVILDLYYGSTLISSQYVEPFSAAKKQFRLADIHLVTSQVWLPLVESQRLMKQMESNGVLFEVKGVFRARSKYGSILKYSYNLYGHCSIMLTRPPNGIMIKRKCRTKR